MYRKNKLLLPNSLHELLISCETWEQSIFIDHAPIILPLTVWVSFPGLREGPGNEALVNIATDLYLHTHTHMHTHTIIAKMVKMEEELSRLRKQVPGMSPSPRERGTATGIITQRKLDKEKNCLTEKYSGIRIK